VVAIAGGGPRGVSVEFVVRDGDSTGLTVSCGNHLTTNEGELGMLVIIRSRNSKVEGNIPCSDRSCCVQSLVRQNTSNLVGVNE